MQAVPLGFALFLLEIAVGGIVVTALLDWDGEVSAGFLFLNTAFLAVFGAGAVWLRSILPVERLLPYPVAGPWLPIEPLCWGATVVLAVVYAVLLRLERRPAARAAGALALGTVWSGMMLGHWYLVTPRLAPRPLLRLTAALGAVLAVQGLLLAWLAVADPTAGIAGGPLAALFWLRVGVGVVFPLGLCYMVWRTARVRSMMSATGLLYIALGTVLTGEIMAKALFFLSGVPV